MDVMKGQSSTDWREERVERDRRRERGSPGWGNMGRSKGISESIPCWTVWELVAVSKHENKHRQM